MKINCFFAIGYNSWWFNPLIATGYKKPLEMSDMYQLRPTDEAHHLSSELWKNWYSQSNPSLLKTLHLTFGTRFYLAGVIKLIYDIIQLTSPYFIKLIVDYVSNTNAPMWQGYLYVILLFLLNVVGTLMINQYFHQVCCACVCVSVY